MCVLRRVSVLRLMTGFLMMTGCLSGFAQAYDYVPEFQESLTFHSELTRDDQCPDGDGTPIDANVFIPQGAPGETFPALIFVPGWGMTKTEYILQAENFARKGYIVFSYSPRGMGESGGVVEVVSPKDIADFCAAVDWVIANTPVDETRIGAYGMSYGGGVSLVGLAHDPRIKVVGSASTWGDLQNSLYEADTPNLIWMNNLILTGSLRSRLSPVIFDMKDNLMARENLDDVIDWAGFRSPLNYVEVFNQRDTKDIVTGETVAGVPLYISKNIGDYLFKSNRLLELYEQSVGPKKMDTNLGIHSMQEQTGMKLEPNTTWDNLHLWFDYWLLGVNNGVMAEPAMSMRVKNWRYRDYFSEWPSEKVATQTLYFNHDLLGGYLGKQPMVESESLLYSAGLESGARVGVPIVSAFLEGMGLLHRIEMDNVDPDTSLEFVGEPLDETLKIRGTMKVSSWIVSEKPKAMLVAYLFELNAQGSAALISHGPVTAHDMVPGEPTQVEFEMATVAYDVNPNHQLLLLIDSFEWLYYSPYPDPYRVEVLVGGDYGSRIEMPVRIAEEVSEGREDAADSDGSEQSTGNRSLEGNGNGVDGETIAGGSFGFWLVVSSLLLLIRAGARY